MNLCDEQGSIIILTAVMILVLMGFVGLAIDTGSFYAHKRALQTSADAGALQGGYELHRGNPTLMNAAALAGTTENGYQHGTDGVTVEVYNPPIAGYYVGDNAAVEVIVRQPSPITFMSLLGWTSPTIPARAVAWAGANSRACIHVLEDDEQDAFDYQSSAVLWAPDCSLMVNSTDYWGGHLTSNADVDVGDAYFGGGMSRKAAPTSPRRADTAPTRTRSPWTTRWRGCRRPIPPGVPTPTWSMTSLR